jgi:hypothetical protein
VLSEKPRPKRRQGRVAGSSGTRLAEATSALSEAEHQRRQEAEVPGGELLARVRTV